MNAFTFHLHEVELMDGLQQGGAIQVEIKVRCHPRGERPFPPLVLGQVNPSDQSIRDLMAKNSRQSVYKVTQRRRSQGEKHYRGKTS